MLISKNCSKFINSFHSRNSVINRKYSSFKGFKEPSWSIAGTLLQKNELHQTTINKEQLLKICKLAYLSPSEEKIPKLCKDISHIVWCLEQIQKVDSQNVLPLLSVLEDYHLKERKDVPRPTSESFIDVQVNGKPIDSREFNFDEEPVILENAKEKDGVFFVVPKQKEPWEE